MTLKHSDASIRAAQIFFPGTPAVVGKNPFKSFIRGNGWQRGAFVRFIEGQSPHLEMKPGYYLHASSVQFYGLSSITQNAREKNCAQNGIKQD